MSDISPKTNPAFLVAPIKQSLSMVNTFESSSQPETFVLYWIREGSAHLELDLHSYRIRDNTMFCVIPGQSHRITPDSALTGHKLAFSTNFLCCGNRLSLCIESFRFADPENVVQVRKLDNSTEDDINEYFMSIICEYENDYENRDDAIHGLLRVLLSYLFAEKMAHTTDAITNSKLIFNEFSELVEIYYRTNRQVAFYASELAMTPNYLCEVVRKITGLSPRHYIQQRVLLEAKRSALNSEKQIKEVAYELGFEDPSTFSKFFKNHSGCNFSDFREKGQVPKQISNIEFEYPRSDTGCFALS